MAGGSIEKLKEILGHYSVVMTERYAHLKPELFTPKDLGTISIDLAPGSASAVEIGQTSARSPNPTSATPRHHIKKAGVVL